MRDAFHNFENMIQQECHYSNCIQIRPSIQNREVCLFKVHNNWFEYYFDKKEDLDEFINELIKARDVIFK